MFVWQKTIRELLSNSQPVRGLVGARVYLQAPINTALPLITLAQQGGRPTGQGMAGRSDSFDATLGVVVADRDTDRLCKVADGVFEVLDDYEDEEDLVGAITSVTLSDETQVIEDPQPADGGEPIHLIRQLYSVSYRRR